MNPTKDAVQLLQDGALALAQVEANGIRIDTEYLEKTIRRTKRKIKHLEDSLESSEVMTTWKKHYRNKFKLGSNEQLGVVMYELLGFECSTFTATGRYKTDEKSLSTIDHPFVKKYMRIKKLSKNLSTYLLGLKKEVVEGFVHPVFNLHLVKTYRGSSDSPNFQNIPVRNPESGKMIRTAYIPRDGNHLVEIDYSGIEVSVAACYHKDPNMISYIKDPDRDMHRDMAAECYLLPEDQVSKPIRHCGKNMFVFPQFYGDWYLSCAVDLWEAIRQMDLTTVDGMPLRDHLEQAGIEGLGACSMKDRPVEGTFEFHLKEVETRFWNERFPVYTQWKKSWMKKYEKRGWFKSKTGFVCRGFMKRNEVINYPVQGAAFHVLLKALILLQKELKRRGMKSLIVGQIHDSIVSDVPAGELEEYLHLVNQITTVEIPKLWKWLIVPLEIEAEVTPLDGCWADKEEVEL